MERQPELFDPSSHEWALSEQSSETENPACPTPTIIASDTSNPHKPRSALVCLESLPASPHA
eukprot:scaffold170272_cov33-Tisochrysis_lutea.AAC.3